MLDSFWSLEQWAIQLIPQKLDLLCSAFSEKLRGANARKVLFLIPKAQPMHQTTLVTVGGTAVIQLQFYGVMSFWFPIIK